KCRRSATFTSIRDCSRSCRVEPGLRYVAGRQKGMHMSAGPCPTIFAVLLLAVPAQAVEQAEPTYLPTQSAAQVLSVAKEADATAGVVVLTEALAIKETGPKATVARFGETYAFSPAVFAVYRDEPTLITFRNLQPDDVHDFMLTDPHGAVLMKVNLP